MAFWTRKTRVVVKNLPPKEFLDDVKEYLGVDKKEFCEMAIARGIDSLSRKLKEDIATKKAYIHHHKVRMKAVANKVRFCPTHSNVPFDSFSVSFTRSGYHIRISVDKGHRLEKSGYLYWKIGYDQRSGKTFIVFSKTMKDGFVPMRIDKDKSSGRVNGYRIMGKSDLLRLCIFLGEELRHAQQLSILSHDVKEDGDLWMEVKAGETQN